MLCVHAYGVGLRIGFAHECALLGCVRVSVCVYVYVCVRARNVYCM